MKVFFEQSKIKWLKKVFFQKIVSFSKTYEGVSKSQLNGTLFLTCLSIDIARRIQHNTQKRDFALQGDTAHICAA